GYHSQMGIQGTYAYHVDFGNRSNEINQLSLAFSMMAVVNSVDETNFTIPDPEITQLVQSKNYFNADIGVAYHLDRFFSYLTAKNILLSARNLYNDNYESLNLRRYLLTVGYYFGKNSSVQFEPSIMTQIIESTGEKFADFNLKVYKDLPSAQLWGGISYRRGFDGNEIEELQYITPIVGVNINKWMFSYTYTKQSGDILFENGGFHQISLGYNLFCRPQRLSGCPNINNSF
ncbi:MAG: PorP/SprF family type IX secretion system membrane protein, partial [Flavobacteriaceae bacterium]|nr:PorP/SprF family type IX secretion system membrane protein [Flavobacteriaceae bacterium]